MKDRLWIRAVLFATPATKGELASEEREALLADLEQLYSSGQLPTLETEGSFELVKELTGWRIFENWASSVPVRFSDEVEHDLPWAFEPVQETVLAKPGETLRTNYRARSLSDQAVTAKARHIDRPKEFLDSLQIIQCFCFIQQTLKPGEQVEMPVIFRIAPDVPTGVNGFCVHYEFYPIESFPSESP